MTFNAFMMCVFVIIMAKADLDYSHWIKLFRLNKKFDIGFSA